MLSIWAVVQCFLALNKKEYFGWFLFEIIKRTFMETLLMVAQSQSLWLFVLCTMSHVVPTFQIKNTDKKGFKIFKSFHVNNQWSYENIEQSTWQLSFTVFFIVKTEQITEKSSIPDDRRDIRKCATIYQK